MNPEPLVQLPHADVAARPWLTSTPPGVSGRPPAFYETLSDPSDVVLQLAQPPVHYASTFGSSAQADAADFARTASPQAALDAARLDQLSMDLGALLGGDPGSVDETCTFHFDVPGLGPIEGQVSMRDGQANVELHSRWPHIAAALRARQQQLQNSIDQASKEDVRLFIV